MRPTHYLQKILASGQVDSIPFDASHYSEAGLLPSISAGMPVLEAHQLVNKWNHQTDQRIVYALPLS